ncbi:hypothetical protein EXS71_00495 [Candidatus Uhrbacteria bacterium]|nr:hypothetical protein [Candidatus Uhrbacteria bacterium]
MTGSPIFFQQLAQAFLAEVPEVAEQDKIIQELSELDQIPTSKLHQVTQNLLCVLLKNGLGRSVQRFLEKLDTLRDRLHIAKHIQITSAEALDTKQREMLRTALSRTWDMHLLFSEHVDPTLLGGFCLEQDGWMFDASVQGQLKRLQQAFTH